MVDENEEATPDAPVSDEALPEPVEAEDADEELADPLAGPALNEFGDPIEE